MYAINIDENNRILRTTFAEYAESDSILVDTLPEGDVHEYKYVDGEYVHDPLPVEEVEEQVSQLDILEAQVTYTAMMTDTLLEV